MRWTRAARQTRSQATGASFTAAASYGVNGGGSYGGRRRPGAVGRGRGTHREAHGGRWELRSGGQRRIRTATTAGADGETARLRCVQGIPAQFLRRSDVVDDGEASGQDGGAVRAHWSRELTAMASGLRGDFSPSENGEGGGENGGGRVQGAGGVALIRVRRQWRREGAAEATATAVATRRRSSWPMGREQVGEERPWWAGPVELCPGRGLAVFPFLQISSAANSQFIYCALL